LAGSVVSSPPTSCMTNVYLSFTNRCGECLRLPLLDVVPGRCHRWLYELVLWIGCPGRTWKACEAYSKAFTSQSIPSGRLRSFCDIVSHSLAIFSSCLLLSFENVFLSFAHRLSF
jgi:hypothetical protein